MSFEEVLPITAKVKKQVRTSDGAGGSKITWTDRIASYKCRIFSAFGMVQITTTGQNVLRTHKCIGEYNADIIEGDAIIDGLDSYRVILVDKVYDKERIHHLEMNLKKENITYA